MPNLPESILGIARRTDILPQGSRILVAVSGGQDSCALLHALHALRTDLSIDLHAAHLNHGFRGEEADADAQFVQDLAAALDIPCTVDKHDVPALAKRLHLSKQEAARRARHEFLDRTADAVGADRIALAHTRDDRVETVVMNVLRGTGIEGLAGIGPRNGRRIRPLLDVSREQSAAYCREHGIAYRLDASNLSTASTRNRVRLDLLPHLETAYNPRVREALLRLSNLATDDAAALAEIARAEMARCTLNQTEGCVVLSVEQLRKLSKAVQRRVLREVILGVRGGLQDVEAGPVERVLAAADTGARFQLTLPDGDISIKVLGEALQIAKRAPDSSVRHIERVVPLEETVDVPELGIRIASRRVTWPHRTPNPASVGCVYIREEELSPPLVVRNRRPGDRLSPEGLGGSKKVQDIFVDSKTPVTARDLLPIVADQRGILWVVGHAVDKRCLRAADGDGVIVVEIFRHRDA